MIALKNIVKTYPLGDGRRRVVLDGISLRFRPGVNMGILGRNGAGKSTLMGIIGGKIRPDAGRVIREGRVSWPLGFAGCFNGSLTGRENLRFVCRIYGRDWRAVSEFVDDFSELGPYMDQPVQTYSSGMKAKLAFGLSMAVGFDYYLIDELTAVGDASFRAKCRRVFRERMKSSTLIVVSHSMATVKEHCQEAAVLDGGRLQIFPDVASAAREYQRVCRSPQIMRCF